MEKGIQILIYIHAACGGLALLGGFIALLTKKGGKAHRKFGALFYYAMLFSGISALIIAVLPNHENPFLFAIGIFSMYFVLTGKRALRFKSKGVNLKMDKLISWSMIVTGILMILLPLLILKKLSIVLTVFAVIGIVLSLRDLQLFKNPEALQKKWLKMHISKMIGGFIAATTAFVVVNAIIPGIYGWFVPGLIGGFFITYWVRKVNKIH